MIIYFSIKDLFILIIYFFNIKIKKIYSIIIISAYSTITFESKKIIVIIDINNTIWFNAKQICTALKYKQQKLAIKTNVNKKDKIQLKNININFKVYQQPDSMYINDPYGWFKFIINFITF